MKEIEERFYDKPAFRAFPIDDNRFTDNEYHRLAVRIMARCDVDMKREVYDDRQKIDFYFEESIFEGGYVDDLMHLMRASDMYELAVLKSRPQTVRLTCHRLKREEKTDSF